MKFVPDRHCPTWQLSYTGWRKWVVKHLPVARWVKPNVKERVMYRTPDGTFVCSPETYEYLRENTGLVWRDGVVGKAGIACE